ncbi:hypothetical protein [Salinispira pacifica]|uniref:Uncharacterized protein n=1 Tax=Salinispira pacifica TaxID=1307761 RepID=V5WDR8_9SPIO|nr:hypothetical protein [Salinispira pacifica]AHC13932.1 hypothetical protein L21SP2_0500 [Salinispira pacifica]
MSGFAAHGEYQIVGIGRVLAVKVSGSWNAEGAERYRKELEHSLISMAEQPFGHIIDVRKWELATPEAMAILKRPQPEIARRNKIFKAQIIQKASLPSLISLNTIDREVKDIFTVSRFSELKDDLLWKIPDADISALEQFFA